jgi:hypothetical protein
VSRPTLQPVVGSRGANRVKLTTDFRGPSPGHGTRAPALNRRPTAVLRCCERIEEVSWPSITRARQRNTVTSTTILAER